MYISMGGACAWERLEEGVRSSVPGASGACEGAGNHTQVCPTAAALLTAEVFLKPQDISFLIEPL